MWEFNILNTYNQLEINILHKALLQRTWTVYEFLKNMWLYVLPFRDYFVMSKYQVTVDTQKKSKKVPILIIPGNLF